VVVVAIEAATEDEDDDVGDGPATVGEPSFEHPARVKAASPTPSHAFTA
jgi:hypothetical protein